MERFMWQSYPAHVKATLFHAEQLVPLRKKSLSERMTQALAFKAAGDRQFASGDFRAAQVKYECAYGLFKYCEKQGQRISLSDDPKRMREVRQEQPDSVPLDGLSRFWLAVDALLASCLVLIAACRLLGPSSNADEAVAAANEALEIRPGYSAALYRRSQVKSVFLHVLTRPYTPLHALTRPIQASPIHPYTCPDTPLLHTLPSSTHTPSQVVILIDGLDQLSDPVAATLRWLPATLPANCSLILSTSAGTPSAAALPRRGWKRTLHMPPLTEAMKVLFLERYLGHLRKGLEKDVLGVLTGAKQTSNPLFLRMTIDELVAVAVHETVLSIARHCCGLHSCLELCDMLLER